MTYSRKRDALKTSFNEGTVCLIPRTCAKMYCKAIEYFSGKGTTKKSNDTESWQKITKNRIPGKSDP